MTLSILHEVTTEQAREILASPGVQYVREDVVEGGKRENGNKVGAISPPLRHRAGTVAAEERMLTNVLLFCAALVLGPLLVWVAYRMVVLSYLLKQ